MSHCQIFSFPPTSSADEDGLLCLGGDLHPDRLMLAYRNGIFPWYNEDEPIQWYSPDPRFVLFPSELKISKSMKQILKQSPFRFSMNEVFSEVIHACRIQSRKGQDGTWLNDDMEIAYNQLHKLGNAISAECWLDNQLVGGLYGIRIGRVFCGESMFSTHSNASKFAFIHLVRYLQGNGVDLIDCQVYTSHLKSLGARLITRNEFESYLK